MLETNTSIETSGQSRSLPRAWKITTTSKQLPQRSLRHRRQRPPPLVICHQAPHLSRTMYEKIKKGTSDLIIVSFEKADRSRKLEPSTRHTALPIRVLVDVYKLWSSDDAKSSRWASWNPPYQEAQMITKTRSIEPCNSDRTRLYSFYCTYTTKLVTIVDFPS